MIKAVYRLRGDGDYDFVAAFETEQLPQPPSDWPMEISDWLHAEGETPLLIEEISINLLPDIYESNGH